MLSRSRFQCRLLSCLAAGLLMAGLLTTPVRAQVAPPKDGQSQAAPAADRYQVPAGGVDKLQQYVEGLLNYQPESRAEALEHRTKRLPAIKAACEKIVKLEADKTSAAYRMARSLLVQLQLNDLPRLNRQQKKAMLEEVIAYVESSGTKTGGHELSAGMALARAMEAFGEPELAAEAYARAGAALAKSENPQVAGNAKSMVGAGRRLSLPGKNIVIEGTRHDGQVFNITSLRGKVVLVDFWATWCGPCVAEIPNMKENYERFNSRGFEIVGISLDQDRAALDSFLKEKELPWIVLHEKNENSNPSAEYYGIMGIPAMFLVGRDGKVISTRARGEELTKLLETEFEKNE